ncbi:hypothetical protein PIB30_015033 [Stylosanthes scabra]|uniref:non-specific serine/threonine protein kinase n=1 Tax=Stylosanthes scabra TaxID=79078 RepID=A0ABU6Y753_9FABA|nr:hypothetical protein [Stylosanthes scabra]
MRGTTSINMSLLLLPFLLMLTLATSSDVKLLMTFKNSHVSSDPNNFLAHWSTSNSKPCTWRGVTCSAQGQLTTINLTGAGLVGTLHLPTLTALPSLQHLILRQNYFSLGNLSVSPFCALQTLDLSSNNFSGDFPFHLLLPCPALTSLNVSRNLITGVTPKEPAFRFGASLLHLDLSRNQLSQPQILTYTLSNCQALLLLNLSDNRISAQLTENILTAACANLTTLDLSHNHLSGELPHSFVVDSLQLLDLSGNNFSGVFSRFGFGSCRNLVWLSLSHNALSGGEFPSSLRNCQALETLDLSHNELGPNIPGSLLAGLKSLKELFLGRNNFNGEIPSELGMACDSLLQVLDLSSNGFTGTIPSALCSSSSPLEKMLLADNYLEGRVPAELGGCKNLRTIDFSFNNLNGPIPSQLWSLANLTDLIMWANNLTGEIHQGICSNSGKLETLILNNNLISGSIPSSIANCTNMVWVSLASNHITGEIPAGIGNLKRLAILQLGNNSLAGQIPPELGECKSLIWLDLNSNNLTGTIPSDLANQAGLVMPGTVSGKEFAFVRNEGGTSCRGAGGLVEFEDIKASRLESFPMVHSCPLTRIYSGVTVYTFSKNGSMIYLDLSYNFLSGSIPASLGAMSYLQVLNMGHNKLSGNIPDSFGGLKAIGVLDLSHNNLQGFIPASLGTLSFLSDLDVSNNNLTGAIPPGGQLTTFPSSRYENNSNLCGVPLPPCQGTSNRNHLPGYHAWKKKQPIAVGIIIGLVFFVLFFLVFVVALYQVKKYHWKEEQREKYIESLPTSGSSSWKLSSIPEPLSINVATFEKPLRKLTFAHLLEATNGFSAETLIGSGGFGEVYKAKLKDGCVVAIKKLIHVTGQGDREFMAEMETIGKIKHRNLVPLLGYCKIGEERLLVYEYMKWGSLEAVLHEGGRGLDWAARKKIAIGSARGLAFLHHSCIPHIIHRDMKSSNILLDENFEARVSDFGMARLVNALDTHLSVSTLAGTPGYVPPEYYQSFRCTTKGDVYSYGVILLELLSGKRPIDSSEFGDDNNLVGWCKQLHKEKRSSEILDPDLIRQASSEGELYQCLRIAFECLEERPYRRPTMIQVMAMFKELQADTDNDVLDGFSLKCNVIEEA